MLHFTRLRLAGFKSFVDPAELRIESGLTGVVGPNGCGKSNLIEALRWVMGETSARQMRGGEMEDVIFGGSAGRPARSVAEVTVTLDNRDRSAPPHYAEETLEVVRRIERGAGSSYRLNGREVRARDVQLLFADAATGARSSGLVSQGRIGSLISARPADRRLLLEEAAGIAGLRSRRAEAESRFKAAELNLERLDDVLATQAEHLRLLQRQARQAARYRELSERIRALEARLLDLAWKSALVEIETARKALRQGDLAVVEATAAAAVAATAAAEAAAALPPARTAAAAAADAMREERSALERIEAEAGRLAEARRDLETRLSQAATDLQREQERANDAARTLARLEAEETALRLDAESEAPARTAAAAVVERAASNVAAGEQALAARMEEIAAADAARAAALRQVQQAETRRDRLRDRLAQVETQRAALAKEAVDPAELTSAEMELEAAEEESEAARAFVEQAEQERTATQKERDRCRDALAAALAVRDRLAAEADALAQVLSQGGSPGFQPVLEAVSASPGYEAALAAALGEDLTAATDPDAPRRWEETEPAGSVPPLPTGTRSLAGFVTAPRALARRLAQVAVVEDATTAVQSRAALAVGQRLVTPAGDLWRWDGYVIQAGAPTAMAIRLAQRNRLRELDARREDAELGLETAEEAAAAAITAAERAAEVERTARDALRRAETDQTRARDLHARLAQRTALHQDRMRSAQETYAEAEATLAEAEEELIAAQEMVASFPLVEDGRELISTLRATVAEQRAELIEARSALDRIEREAGERARRRDALAAERDSWRGRAEACRDQIAELESRQETLLFERDRLDRLPDRFERERAERLDRLTAAETVAQAAADRLAGAEMAQTEADRAARAAEQALATAREERVRREAAVSNADQACRAIAARIAERLDLSPEQVAALVAAAPPEEGGPAEMRRRLDRLERERDQIGPVNLCAEQEATEQADRIAALQAEKDDLVAAIAKLRQAIGELNREAREKLLASFEAVDRDFRDLFIRLFGGGRAHLALTDSPDPLDAGLEIMASPPGKRLQTLSLLSGGEQALTALALLFAVFLTNPAPICVLDEVDAPLDDANVDRFCTLVDSIAATTQTRFLVITHHRMTMARMDRLYGVTMAERGVSQLVSVDLTEAETLRDA